MAEQLPKAAAHYRIWGARDGMGESWYCAGDKGLRGPWHGSGSPPPLPLIILLSRCFCGFFPSLGVGVGAAGSTSGLVIVLILVLAPWRPEQIMKEEKRGQGGAQAADFCPSAWARAGGDVEGGC